MRGNNLFSYVQLHANMSRLPAQGCTRMRHLGLSSCLPQVFAGALGALAAMTVLSAVMGWAAPSLVSTTSRC